MQKDNERLLLIGGGVLVAGYFAYQGVIKPILEALNLLDDKDEQARKDRDDQALADALAAAQAKEFQTYTDQQLSAFANTIFEDLRYSALDDDKEQAGLYLAMPRNDTDVLKLIYFFGRRQECFFGVACYDRTLPDFVSSNLSSEKIAAINDNYRRKNISYRW